MCPSYPSPRLPLWDILAKILTRVMSYFPNAFQPHLENCYLYDVGGAASFVTVNQVHGPSNDALIVQQGITILANNIAIDAAHNSQARFPPPKCYPATRGAILDNIIDWINERTENCAGNKMILWIYGPAGAGKSAIAQTIAERLEERRILAASFFFTRGMPCRGTSTYLIVTIASQLTVSIPEMRDIIGRAIAGDPTILGLSMDLQIQRLIVEPFRSFLAQQLTFPKTLYPIIIDGLDECDGDDDQSRILSHVADLFHKHDLPLIFVIASRPEPHITDSFRKDQRLASITQEFHLDPSDEDIRIFLVSSFNEIRHTHSALVSLSEPWPSQTHLNELVYRSSGSFIYASTVVKFVGDKDMHPSESLDVVLSSASTPLSALDDLYRQILSTTPESRRPLLITILEVLVAYDSSNEDICLWDLDELLSLREGSVRLALRRMHSLLKNIDVERDPEMGPIQPVYRWLNSICFVHKSFLDFLRNKERSASMGFVAWPFCDYWDDHLNELKHTPFPEDTPFLEYLRSIETDTWKKCLETMDPPHPVSEILEAWISALQKLPSPPDNVIQRLTSLLDTIYLEELEAGDYSPIPVFLKETNPGETIYTSIEGKDICIIRDCYFGAEGHLRGNFQEFILDKSRCGTFIFDPLVGHAAAFDKCITIITSTYPISERYSTYERKWWTFHLSQCSPSLSISNKVLEGLQKIAPWITDINGANRVIDWLEKLCDPPTDLVSRWKDYRQILLNFWQQAHSSSLYCCIEN